MSNALIAALRATPCPYAARAEVRCASQAMVAVDDGVLWRTSFSSIASLVRELADSADLLAIELPSLSDTCPRNLLAQVTHTLLSGLFRFCNGDSRQLYAGIESGQWEYTLMNRDFFPLVLSPVYPAHHPRHVGWRQPVILLQPESSFTRHGISSASAERERISTSVEGAFLRAGRQYHGQVTRGLPKAYRVVKPASEADPPIRWWDTPTLAVECTTT
jgi:hypothetical protein